MNRNPAYRKLDLKGFPLASSFNLYRKIWHIAGILIPLMFYAGVFDWLHPVFEYPTRTAGILILLLITVTVLIMDILRLRYRFWNRLFRILAGPLLKKEEDRRINATVPYFISLILLMLFFSYELVVLGTIYLMMGDPAAAWAGGRFGKHRFRNGKSAEGLAGFILSSFFFGLLFIIVHTLVSDGSSPFSFSMKALTVILAGAVAAAFAELHSENSFYGLMDDNLIVPVAGALAAALTAWVFFSFPPETLFFNPLKLLYQRNSL